MYPNRASATILTQQDRGKPCKSVRVAGAMREIQIRHIPNIFLERYCAVPLFSYGTVYIRVDIISCREN